MKPRLFLTSRWKCRKGKHNQSFNSAFIAFIPIIHLSISFFPFNSFTFLYSYILPFSCIHSCIYSCIYSCIHSCIHLFMHSFMHSFIYSCIHSCIHSCMHSFILSITHFNPFVQLRRERWSSLSYRTMYWARSGSSVT